MSDTESSPPATRQRGAAKKAAAATPPPIEGMKPAPEPVDEQLFSVDQQRRLEALKASKELLGRDVTAGELLDLTIYIEYGLTTSSPAPDDDGPALTFTGAPNQEGTIQ